MKLTTQRKVYFALAAVAGAALVVDRVWFADSGSGPAVASAAMPPSVGTTNTGRLNAYARIQNALCARLEGIPADVNPVTDPFQITPVWAPLAHAESNESKSGAQKGDASLAFKLTSIALVNRNTGERLAVINGHSLTLGDVVLANKLPTDSRVVGIDPTAVWISNGVKDVRLSLDGGSPDKRSVTGAFYGVRTTKERDDREKSPANAEPDSSR